MSFLKSRIYGLEPKEIQDCKHEAGITLAQGIAEPSHNALLLCNVH
jgi:hypothetical protein